MVGFIGRLAAKRWRGELLRRTSPGNRLGRGGGENELKLGTGGGWRRATASCLLKEKVVEDGRMERGRHSIEETADPDRLNRSSQSVSIEENYACTYSYIML